MRANLTDRLSALHARYQRAGAAKRERESIAREMVKINLKRIRAELRAERRERKAS